MRISDWSSDVCSSDLIDAACIGKRDIAQIKEQQHQHARHAAIPFPPRPPGWTAPDRARHKTNGGKQRPRRGNGAARYACEWMTPDDLYQAGDRSAERRVGNECVSKCRLRGWT